MGKRGPRKKKTHRPDKARSEKSERSRVREQNGFLTEVWPAVAFLVLAAAVALAPGLGGELLNWDDDRFVRDNELIRDMDVESLVTIFSRPHFEAYQPLHLLSLQVDYQLFGLWAPGYKLHSFLLWALCLVLLLLLLRRLEFDKSAALAGALLFTVHPLHVESVCWITARKDSLSLALMLGSALLYLTSERWNDRRSWLSLVLFGLALLAKSSTVVLPAALLLVDTILLRKPWRSSLLRLVPQAVLAAGIGVLVIMLWEENEIARPLPENGYLGHVALVGKTYWHYLASICWPAGLSPVYPVDRVGAFGWRVIAGFVLWLALGVAAWRSKDRALLVGALWAAVALLPVSNIIPVYFFVQDRYTLIATIGVAVIGASLFRRFTALEGARTPVRIGFVVVLVALAAVSAYQASHWRNSHALWTRATTVQPNAYYGFLALGHTERDGEDFDAAIEAYQRAVAIEPGLPYGRISLCLADARRNVQRTGRPEGEVDRIGVALRRGWGSPAQLRRLALWLGPAGYLHCADLAETRASLLDPTANFPEPPPDHASGEHTE